MNPVGDIAKGDRAGDVMVTCAWALAANNALAATAMANFIVFIFQFFKS